MTIGFGHVIQPGENYERLSVAEATALLKQDVTEYIPTYLMKALTANGVYLKQHEFDALVSLCFNSGPGRLTYSNSPNFNPYLLAGKYTPEEIEAHFGTYTKQNGVQLAGLIARRKAEANMFNYGIYDSSH
jgi:GH24 family phage-related lysozyme (muramidase)